MIDFATIGKLAGLSGLLGGGKSGDISVAVSTPQSLSQMVGISTNPIITVSSPQSAIKPSNEGGSTAGAPITQSAPITTSQPDVTPNQGLLPSLSLPSGDATYTSPQLVSSPSNSLFDNPIMLVLMAGAAWLLMSNMRGD